MYKINCTLSPAHRQLLQQAVITYCSKTAAEVTCWSKSFKRFSSNTKLEHVGILSENSTQSTYVTGQTFLHRVFAYRGVVLHAWNARVYEKNRDPLTSNETRKKEKLGKQSVPKVDTYYQVLVDSRDSAKSSAKCEITYLKNPSSENYPIERISDMDYVSHDDIIPYTSVEDVPICHDLFDKFLVRSNNLVLQGTKTLHRWQERNRLWLEMCNVYIEVTNNIRVTVIPFHLGVKALVQPSVFWWRYLIRIENLGKETVQLRKRHWRIISGGSVTKQAGGGVIGKEPILSSTAPAFQYSSQVPLWTPNGHMWGTYLFEKQNGEPFEVCIPAFALESKLDDSDLNGQDT